MASKPELVSIDALEEDILPLAPGIDDSGELAVDVRRMSLYADGRPAIEKQHIQDFLQDKRLSRQAIEGVIDRFVSLSQHPDITRDLANEFINTRLGYKVQDHNGDPIPLSVQHGIQTKIAEQPLSILYFSADTCDQLAMMFLTNMELFSADDVRDISAIVLSGYVEAGYTMALYEYFAYERWADSHSNEGTSKRYTRAAKKIIEGLIGHDEFMGADNMLPARISGVVAFRKITESLTSSEIFEKDRGIQHVQRLKGTLCLRALRATDDELFLGIASNIGSELEDAYIKAAVDVGFPRSID